MRKKESAFSGDGRILILILAVAAILRAPGLLMPLYFDEASWAWGVGNFMHGVAYTQTVPHPPLGILGYAAFAYAFGYSIPVLRFVPFIIGLAVMLVTFLLAKDLFGRRPAFIAIALMSLALFHIWASLFVDVDGGFLTLFMLLTVYFYNGHVKGGENRLALLSGISFGLALLSKYSAAVLIPVLVIAHLLNFRLKNWKGLSMIFAIGFVMLSAFPLACIATSNVPLFSKTLEISSSYLSLGLSMPLDDMAVSLFKVVLFLFQYMTPVLPLLALYFLVRNPRQRKGALSLFVILFVIFYSFVMTGGSKSKYLSVLNPPIAIMAGFALSGLMKPMSRRVVAGIFALVALFIVVLSVLNSYGASSDFNSQTASLSLAAENGLFWYNGFASAPFAIRIHSFIFIALLSLACFPFLFSKKERIRDASLFVLIASNAAFGALIIEQSYLPSIGPSYSEGLRGIASFYDEHYAAGNDIALFRSTQFQVLYATGLNMSSIIDETGIKNFDGRVAILDIQFMSVGTFSGVVDAIKARCTEEKVIYSNGYPFGYIFSCGSLSGKG